MGTLAQIEAAIGTLPREELRRLKEFIDRRCEDDWDAQFEADVRAGKVDSLAEQAAQEIEAGETEPLDEFLRHP
jgi:hypothetical protein